MNQKRYKITIEFNEGSEADIILRQLKEEDQIKVIEAQWGEAPIAEKPAEIEIEKTIEAGDETLALPSPEIKPDSPSMDNSGNAQTQVRG